METKKQDSDRRDEYLFRRGVNSGRRNVGLCWLFMGVWWLLQTLEKLCHCSRVWMNLLKLMTSLWSIHKLLSLLSLWTRRAAGTIGDILTNIPTGGLLHERKVYRWMLFLGWLMTWLGDRQTKFIRSQKSSCRRSNFNIINIPLIPCSHLQSWRAVGWRFVKNPPDPSQMKERCKMRALPHFWRI